MKKAKIVSKLGGYLYDIVAEKVFLNILKNTNLKWNVDKIQLHEKIKLCNKGCH